MIEDMEIDTFQRMARIGASTLEELSGGAPVIVLAPHADDESLGCGALLAAAFAGPGAHVVNITDGRKSHANSRRWSGDRIAGLRSLELLEAVLHLGGKPKDITFLGHEDCRTPTAGSSFDDTVGIICHICGDLAAQSLFVTSDTDSHFDHQAAAAIARAVRERLPFLRLFFYPIWSRWQSDRSPRELDRLTPHRFDSRPWRHLKRAAIHAHRSQLGLVIGDDPQGFVLPDAMIGMFLDQDEWFFEDHDGRRNS